MSQGPSKSFVPAKPFEPGNSLGEKFEEGNQAATRHGLWSKSVVSPLARELVVGLLADRPDLSAYPETVSAWARAEARCILLEEHFSPDRDGNSRLLTRFSVHPAARFLAQFERLAESLRARLGLDPKGEADLAAVRAQASRDSFDVTKAIQTGQKVIEARERREQRKARRVTKPTQALRSTSSNEKDTERATNL